MKIKKLAAICKQNGRCIIYDVIDAEGAVRQWISNGYAAYPIDGMPYLLPEHIPTVFELSEKQADEMVIRKMDEPETIDFSDAAVVENRTEMRKAGLVWGGTVMRAYPGPNGMVWADDRYLAPVRQEYDGAEVWIRESEYPYLAIKAGLLLVGIVLPVRDNGAMTEGIRELL